MPTKKGKAGSTKGKKVGTPKNKGKVGTACVKTGTRRKISGKNFTLKVKKSSKRDATKAAETHRKKGKNKFARVIKLPGNCGYGVYTRG